MRFLYDKIESWSLSPFFLAPDIFSFLYSGIHDEGYFMAARIHWVGIFFVLIAIILLNL